MTTEARNEAADYLRLGMPKPLHAKLGEALAAERRATVERIRELISINAAADDWLYLKDALAILDEEAAR